MKKHGKKNKHKNKKSHEENSQLRVLNVNKYKKKHQKGISHSVIDALEKSGGTLSANLSTGSIDAEVWCKWTILNGTRLDPVWLFARLKEIIRFMFLPVNMKREGSNIVFFMYMTRRTIEDARIDLRSFLDPVQGKEIVVNIVQVPDVGPLELTEDTVKERLLELLRRRFQQVTVPSGDGSVVPITRCRMDLSALHLDDFLLNHQIVASLAQNSVAGFIVDTMCQNLEELHEIILSDNKLTGLGAFKRLFSKFPMLLRLDLSQNRLQNIEQELVQPLVNLQELVITNTPFHTRSTRETGRETFHQKLWTMFPSLRSLNGDPLVRKEQSIDVVKAVPPMQVAYFIQQNVTDDVKHFILNYLTLMDTNRQGLLEYYGNASVLTFHCRHHDLMGNPQKNKTLRLSQSLLNASRNLLSCKDIAQRRDSVKRGPLQIVAFLDTFPRTEHIIRNDIGTFRVDVPVFTSTFMQLHFQGVFKEVVENETVLRQFSRTMLIVQPQTILNDDWFVTTAANQVRSFFPEDHPVSVNSNPSAPISSVSHEDLISRLSELTKMNRPFSEKCLIDSAWDLERAIATFQSLNASKLIPDIAFVQ